MRIKDKLAALGKTFKFDSHHAIQRFGAFFGALVVSGVLVLTTTGFSALMADRDNLAETALWTKTFTTSKTQLSGDVDGVYTNELKNRVLVMMHFDERAKISYNAEDYEAFLLGSDGKLNSETLDTPGVTGSFHVFGATGYVGVVLEGESCFDQQVLNLTIRANEELSFTDQQAAGDSADQVIGDASFVKYDQWRVFFNPGASGTTPIAALESRTFDPARAFYEVVLKADEEQVRVELDTKLAEMRTNQSQINSYSDDLVTTKVDGLFLRPPTVPSIIDGDEVLGDSAAEAEDGVSTLALDATEVVPGGFDFDWRSGNVYDGYLNDLVGEGQSYVDYLQTMASESSNTGENPSGIGDIEWILSNGKSLTADYRTSDVTMRPLMTVMNNLAQAYQEYYANKSVYQSDLLLDLLALEVDLRDVRSNSTVNADEGFLVTYY